MKKEPKIKKNKQPDVPQQWKKAIIAWLGIFPLITVLSYAVGDLTANHPLFVRTFLVTSIAVPLMTFIIIPWLTKALSRWLVPKGIS